MQIGDLLNEKIEATALGVWVFRCAFLRLLTMSKVHFFLAEASNFHDQIVAAD